MITIRFRNKANGGGLQHEAIDDNVPDTLASLVLDKAIINNIKSFQMNQVVTALEAGNNVSINFLFLSNKVINECRELAIRYDYDMSLDLVVHSNTIGKQVTIPYTYTPSMDFGSNIHGVNHYIKEAMGEPLLKIEPISIELHNGRDMVMNDIIRRNTENINEAAKVDDLIDQAVSKFIDTVDEEGLGGVGGDIEDGRIKPIESGSWEPPIPIAIRYDPSYIGAPTITYIDDLYRLSKRPRTFENKDLVLQLLNIVLGVPVNQNLLDFKVSDARDEIILSTVDNSYVYRIACDGVWRLNNIDKWGKGFQVQTGIDSTK